jgi:hypothetical protein
LAERRRIAAPARPKPPISMAQAAGSGTPPGPPGTKAVPGPAMFSVQAPTSSLSKPVMTAK